MLHQSIHQKIPENLTGKPKKYIIRTLGCKANLYDSQLLEAELQKKGWIPAQNEEDAELCIVNSCTVTNEADRQSKRMATQATKKNAHIKVVMTGCGAEVMPRDFAKNNNIHYVVGNQNKNRLVDLVTEAMRNPDSPVLLGGVSDYKELLSRHPMDREWATPESSFMLPPIHLVGEAGRTRSFIKIQEGCNAFCTYCIIPYGRGPSRSLPISRIIDQVKELCDQGAQEIILTGTNIGEYGIDLNENPNDHTPQLESLIRTLLKETPIPRIRVSSLNPAEITSGLIQLMSDDTRFCPHFHVSLQSVHPKILKLMKRKYSYPEVEKCLHAISKIPAPMGGVFVGMDIITGFPGETDEIFEESYETLKKLPWSRLHVFPYSERKGTPATRLPGNIPPLIRKQRAKKLMELSLERLKSVHQTILDYYQSKKRVLNQVLMESATRGPQDHENWVGGYTPNYIRVLAHFDQLEQAKQLKNTIVSLNPQSLLIDSHQGDVAIIAQHVV